MEDTICPCWEKWLTPIGGIENSASMTTIQFYEFKLFEQGSRKTSLVRYIGLPELISE